MELKANTTSEKIDTIHKMKVELGVSKGCVFIKCYEVSGEIYDTIKVRAKSSKEFDIPQFFQIQFECDEDSVFSYVLK